MTKNTLLLIVGSILVLLVAFSAAAPASEVTSATTKPASENVQSPITMAARILFQDRISEPRAVQSASPSTGLNMQDRIQFHDRLLNNPAAENHPVTTMADRILFQDRISEPRAVQSASPSTGLTMQDRIQFHDRLLDNPAAENHPATTMAERIRFQDKLWD